MKAEQLRTHIIQPVLKYLGYGGKNVEELLLLTAAQESAMGKYIHQLNGPALGIYQMEPQTHDDIWSNYLKYKSDLSTKVQKWNLNSSFPYDNAYQMCGNLYYATAMARIHYLRVSEPIPEAGVGIRLAEYYKEYYNTHLGAATPDEALGNYNKYV